MRALRYSLMRLYVRMVREKASPEYVAKGWALGMFIGCAVPFGLQLVVSIPLSFALKCSKIGATFGTLLTNPVTIFFIYPAQTYVAHALFFGGSDYAAVEAKLGDTATLSFATLRALGGEMVASFLLGGLMLALVMTPLTYWFVLHLVRQYRRIRESRHVVRA